MAANENLDIVIRLRGGQEAAAKARQVASSLKSIDDVQGKVRVSSRKVGEETKNTQHKMVEAIATTLRFSAAFAAIAAVGNTFASGFRFNATMEQNTVAFTHFLGSTEAARKELDTLYTIAAKTPFQFSDVTSAARRFLAFGFTVQEANRELGILGDAVAGIGGGADDINRLILAIGQIRAKGRLQADELLQLTELGLVGTQQIAKQMGMTGAEFLKQVERGKVGSEEAIRAINAVLVAQFKGSADEQSRTLIGQLSTIRDYGAQAMGALVQPITDLARSDILPAISAQLQKWSEYLKAGGADDLYDALGKILRIVGPLTAALITYRSVVWGVAAAQSAWAVAASSTAVAMASLLVSAETLGEVFYVIGTGLGILAAAGGLTLGAIIALVLAVIAGIGLLYWKVEFVRDAINSLGKGLWWFFSGIGEIVIGSVVKWAGVAWDLLQKLWGLVQDIGGAIKGIFTFKLPDFLTHGLDIPGIPFMATGGTIPVGGAAVVGDRGPEIARNTGGGTTITPMGQGQSPGGTRVLQPVNLHIDGRVFAEVMLDIGQTAAARA